MNKIITVILFALCSANCFSQKLTVHQYIEMYKDLAIAEMKRSGIPASVTLAQGILESESGNSWLTSRSNNHFGIKCKSSWTGETVSHDDDESQECFRKYNTAEESYRDHSDFLRNSARYAALFQLDPSDYKGWAYGLKKAGYATNPRYPNILISSIEKYNLHQYTLAGLQNRDSNILNESPVVQNVQPPAHNDLSAQTKNAGLKAIYAAKGTSLLAIAVAQDIPLHRLMEYNDLEAEGLLAKDQWIYFEEKSNQGNISSHTVAEQESIYDISQKYGVQLFYLLEYNDLPENEILEPGTIVQLQMPAVAAKKETVIHDVQPKEGLYSISKKYNVTVDELRERNNLTSDNLRIGQRLIISK